MAKKKHRRAAPPDAPERYGVRPTPERTAKCRPHMGRTAEGRRIYSHPDATPLRRAHAHNAQAMTRAMVDAGERYEADRRIVWGSPSGRDSLDPSPRGGEAPGTEAHARAQIRLYDAERAVSVAITAEYGALSAPAAIDTLRDVCHAHANLPQPRSRARGLVDAALRALAAHYGIEDVKIQA
jgi:hypothetical protein